MEFHAFFCNFDCFFFFKNLLFTPPHLMFTYYSLFSGQTYIEEWFISSYNAFFTACPPNFRACADLIVHPDMDGKELSLELPNIYYIGRLNTIFTGKNFFFTVSVGFAFSMVCFYGPMKIVNESHIMNAQGETIDFWVTSSTIGMIIIVTANLAIWFHSRYLSNWNLIAFFVFSFGFYYMYLWVSNFTHWVTINHSIVAMHTSPLVWATALVIVTGLHAINLVYVGWKYLIRPGPAEILSKMAGNGERTFSVARRKEFEEACAREKTRYDRMEEVRLE